MAATTRRARAGGAKPEGAARSTKATMKATRMQNNLWSLSATIARRLCDPGDALALCLVAAALLVGECFLCALVIVKVPYTEIDWEAYMEEVGGFLAGERDYKNLKGGTGPLVYPAGFVYLYSFLQKSTLGSVRPAQWFFAGVYLATHAVVLALYVKSRVVPPLSLTLLSLSKRLHSIYLLRCFNDGAAMLLAWGATLLLVRALSSDDGGGKKEQGGGKGKSSNGVGGEGGSRKKSLLVVASVAAFSLAVSVKMNVLLMAPPVAVLLLQAARVQEIASGVLFGTALQVLLGLPFLLRFPGSYLGRAFELGRVFTHKWSVNFAFLSEEAFVSKRLALGLAAAHLGVLFAFAGWRWTRGGEGEGGKGAGKGGLVSAAAECWDASFPKKSKSKTSRSKASSSSSSSSSARHRPALAAAHVFRVVAVGNFIGVVFARSLHYQFYSWYAHSLPLLLWSTPFPLIVKLSIWLAIEGVWSSFPPSPLGSAALWGAHLLLLAGLWVGAGEDEKRKKKGEDSAGS